MCIKFSPKSVNLAWNIKRLVLMLLANFVLKSTKKNNLLHHCRKLVQIWYHTGAGTKMHKCLVRLRTKKLRVLLVFIPILIVGEI